MCQKNSTKSDCESLVGSISQRHFITSELILAQLTLFNELNQIWTHLTVNVEKCDIKLNIGSILHITAKLEKLQVR